MKNLLIILNSIFFLFLFGCTSVPHVEGVMQIGDGKYDVAVDRDYLENPQEFKYAINSFVKEQGQTSYDVERHGSDVFYITMPGKTEVEDLPKIRHYHKGRTVFLVVPLATGGFFVTYILLMMFTLEYH